MTVIFFIRAPKLSGDNYIILYLGNEGGILGKLDELKYKKLDELIGFVLMAGKVRHRQHFWVENVSTKRRSRGKDTKSFAKTRSFSLKSTYEISEPTNIINF